MRRSRWMIAGFLSSVLCAWQPTPEVAAQDASANYHVTDRDDNAKIDRQEYQQRIIDVFYFADQNKDGVVTIEELVVIETADPAAFKKADKNGDGKLTVAEFVEYRMLDFDAADVDKDGYLSVVEVQRWDASPHPAH